ncbi:hypothetical protein B6K89_16095 [Bacillus subtilis]|nr:hypothetical protein B6K89_16095 [Bacillus subtilis]
MVGILQFTEIILPFVLLIVISSIGVLITEENVDRTIHGVSAIIVGHLVLLLMSVALPEITQEIFDYLTKDIKSSV